jgi:hypothetical protein
MKKLIKRINKKYKMSVANDVNELNNLTQEIKRMSRELKVLRRKAKEAEARIVEYLKVKETPGVKFQGKALILQSKERHIKKKKVEQEIDALEVLAKYNIDNPQEALKEILNARKGNATEVHKIKIKTL